MSAREDIGAEFLTHVAKHVMTVEMANGVHRSLLFREPGTNNRYFRIVTYPGELVITGDMSTFVFSRLRDMFEFFRQDCGQVNLSYWSEKLIAHDKHSGHKVFDEDLFASNVAEAVKNYLDGADLSTEQVAELSEIIDDEVLPRRHDGEHEAIRSMVDVEFDGECPFSDFYEFSNREYTYHFLWCCHAIVWGVQQFDEYQDALKRAGALPQLSEVAQ